MAWCNTAGLGCQRPCRQHGLNAVSQASHEHSYSTAPCFVCASVFEHPWALLVHTAGRHTTPTYLPGHTNMRGCSGNGMQVIIRACVHFRDGEDQWLPVLAAPDAAARCVPLPKPHPPSGTVCRLLSPALRAGPSRAVSWVLAGLMHRSAARLPRVGRKVAALRGGAATAAT